MAWEQKTEVPGLTVLSGAGSKENKVFKLSENKENSHTQTKVMFEKIKQDINEKKSKKS